MGCVLSPQSLKAQCIPPGAVCLAVICLGGLLAVIRMVSRERRILYDLTVHAELEARCRNEHSEVGTALP